MKGGVSSEAQPPTKKQKKVKTQNESEADAAGKGSSEKEGSTELELENKATLTTIVSTLDIISRKFDQIDSRLEAYELDRNRPLMDQKTIDDRVNALLEEHLKYLGIGKIPKNHDNPSPPLSDNSLSMASPVVRSHQISVNNPALVAATPGKEFGPKKNLAKELEKESGVKRTLDEEFGSVDKATDMRPLDFVVVSPAKATKDDKGEEAGEKKKAAQADAAFKRKEKAEAKKKATEDKKKEAEAKKKEAKAKKKVVEAKKKEAELKKKQEEHNEFSSESNVGNSEVVRSAIIKDYREKNVRLTPKGLSMTAVSSSLVFSKVGHDGTTCMRRNVTPSSAIYDPLAPFDPALLEKLMQHIKAIPPKPPAAPCKKGVLIADHETISRKKFSFRRRSKRYTPQNTQVDDCRVYSLKFVECLALGVTFDGINDQNIQGLRMKMAADILAEGGNVVTDQMMPK
ncbi:hypothetical protein Bca4012_099880 [Brassica carinata]